MANEAGIKLYEKRIKDSKNPQEIINRYKKITFEHGLYEFLEGVIISSAPYLLKISEHDLMEIPKYLGAYLVFEGLTDILFRQRKHHLLSNLLESLGIHIISAPKVSDLERITKEEINDIRLF